MSHEGIKIRINSQFTIPRLEFGPVHRSTGRREVKVHLDNGTILEFEDELDLKHIAMAVKEHDLTEKKK